MGDSDLERTRADLILTELDLVKTFLQISTASPHQSTRARNQRNAWKAYVVAREFSSALVAVPKMHRTIQKRLAEAKKDLDRAGVDR